MSLPLGRVGEVKSEGVLKGKLGHCRMAVPWNVPGRGAGLGCMVREASDVI